jgi:chromosome partitioning protein
VPRCIAFHSYKGGTGKTTIAANLAAQLAKNGYKVLLADFDIYAPSLNAYFGARPKKWINDYLFGDSEIGETVTDLTAILNKDSVAREKTASITNGKLWLAFSNPRKEEIYKLDVSAFNFGKQANSNLQILRRFIKLKEEVFGEYSIDYIIIDTSPGIKYWSINSLAIADTLILTLKMGDFDIEATTNLIYEIYDSFSELGAKSYLLLNRVSGYCTPKGLHDISRNSSSIEQPSGYIEPDLQATETMLSSASKLEILSAIPCYCDIQFSQREFLTCMNYPDHPFTKHLQELAKSEQIKL